MSQFEEKYKISDNRGGSWIWQNMVKCGTQMAVVGTQEKRGDCHCRELKLSCRGGEGSFLGSSEPQGVFCGV